MTFKYYLINGKFLQKSKRLTKLAAKKARLHGAKQQNSICRFPLVRNNICSSKFKERGMLVTGHE